MKSSWEKKLDNRRTLKAHSLRKWGPMRHKTVNTHLTKTQAKFKLILYKNEATLITHGSTLLALPVENNSWFGKRQGSIYRKQRSCVTIATQDCNPPLNSQLMPAAIFHCCLNLSFPVLSSWCPWWFSISECHTLPPDHKIKTNFFPTWKNKACPEDFALQTDRHSKNNLQYFW